MALLRLFGFGAIGQWRDAHVQLARAVLEQAAFDLIESLDAELAKADWQDGLIDQTRFIAARIAPVVRGVAEPLARRVVEEADRSLAELVEHPPTLRWRPRPPEADTLRDLLAELQDWAVAGGTALFGAVRSAAGRFPASGGLTAPPAPDWMRDRAEQRLRARVHAYVMAVVVKGPKGRPSILEELTALIQHTAREARRL